MRLSIDISDETHRELKAKAAREGVTISDIVRIAVEKYVRGNFSLGYSAKLVETSVVAATPPNVAAGTQPFKSLSKADQAKGKTRK